MIETELKDRLIAKAVRASRAEGYGLLFMALALLVFGLGCVGGGLVLGDSLLLFVTTGGGTCCVLLGLLCAYIVVSSRQLPAEMEHVLRNEPHRIRRIRRVVVSTKIEGLVEVNQKLNVSFVAEGGLQAGIDLSMKDGEAFFELLRDLAPQAQVE